MAGFTVSSLTDFTQKASQMFQASVLFSEDYKKYGMEMNVPYKKSVKYISAVASIQDYACALTVSGATTFTEKDIETKHMKFEDSFCIADYKDKGLEDIDVMKETINSLSNQIKLQTDEMFWVGTSATTFAGLVTQWKADAAVLTSDVSIYATGQTLSNTNIDDAIDAIYSNYTPAMRDQGQIVFHMNYKSLDLYRKWVLNSSAAYGLIDAGVDNTNEYKIYGIPNAIIRAEAYIADNEIYATYDKNIIRVYDEKENISGLRLVADPYKPEEVFYIMAQWKFGVSYKFGAEVVRLKNA